MYRYHPRIKLLRLLPLDLQQHLRLQLFFDFFGLFLCLGFVVLLGEEGTGVDLRRFDVVFVRDIISHYHSIFLILPPPLHTRLRMVNIEQIMLVFEVLLMCVLKVQSWTLLVIAHASVRSCLGFILKI